MGSGAAAKKHFQDTEGRADSEKRVVCLGGTQVHGGGRVVGSRGAGGARAGMGQGCAGLRPGCQHGEGWKLQGLRGLGKGLQRVRN